MLNLGIPELVILLVIILFGVGRISKISGEIGRSTREFRTGLSGKDDKEVKKDA